MNAHNLSSFKWLFITLTLTFFACDKNDTPSPEKVYSSEIVQAWINFDLRLLRANPAILNNFIMVQHWAYSSIALYEATLAGRNGYKTLTGQLDQMPAIPAPAANLEYHQPTIANAVFAAMKRNFYATITTADKTSTDSLEAAFNTRYQSEVNAETFQRSVDYGKAVAQVIYDWAKTDGSLSVNPPWILPIGPGQYEKTPPALSAPQNPYWANNRPLIAGSLAAGIPPPPAFSTDPSSEFYKAAKEVYDLSQTLTEEQKDQVIFWRDVPGGGHAHWLAIFSQVLQNEGDKAMFDKAVLVYVKMGITQSDARIATWKAKYSYNLLRPVTFIRSVMAKSSWNSFITTPNHPEYPSAHSSFSVPAAAILTKEFGDNYIFSDMTYNFLGLKARSFNSFNHAAKDAGESRVVGGLHYRFAIDAGEKLGNAIVKYMEDKIRFK